MFKKYLIFMFFVLNFGFSQNFNFEAYKVSKVKITNDDGSNVWVDWEDCQVFIVINGKEETLVVYGEKTINYKIIEVSPELIDSDGYSVFLFKCKDKYGYECVIKYREIEDDTVMRKQLFFAYGKTEWVFKLK